MNAAPLVFKGKNMKLFMIVFLVGFLVWIEFARGEEPVFCDVKYWNDHQVASNPTLTRAKTFKIGDKTIAGLGVGDSPTESVKAMSLSADDKYCTFYLNDGNSDAAKSFIHQNIGPNPLWPWFSGEKMDKEFLKNIGGILTSDPITVQSCLKKNKYVALGCDGMRHRGPSGFSWLLVFAGCSPKSAVGVVQKLWPVEWYRGPVSSSKRIEMVQSAVTLREQNPEKSMELRRLFVE